MTKNKTHQLVNIKDNQIALHCENNNVDYILELNVVGEEIEITYVFPDANITEDIKNDIIDTTSADLKSFFKEN